MILILVRIKLLLSIYYKTLAVVQGEAVFNPKARHPSHSSSITATDDSNVPIHIGSTSTLPHPKPTQIPKLFKGHSSIAPVCIS